MLDREQKDEKLRRVEPQPLKQEPPEGPCGQHSTRAPYAVFGVPNRLVIDFQDSVPLPPCGDDQTSDPMVGPIGQSLHRQLEFFCRFVTLLQALKESAHTVFK